MLSSDIFWQKVIPALNTGFFYSILLIVPSAILGFLGGVTIGAMRVFAPKPIARVFDFFVAIIRGVPLLLQLVFIYYGLPNFGITLSAYSSAILGFTLCSAAYQSEYIRGALLSIRSGQIKAAFALGFSQLQMITTIIIPQAVRRALPGCGNEIIYLIKYSSLAYVITFIELTGSAQQQADRSWNYIEVFLVAGAYYLVLTTLASCILQRIENRIWIPGFGHKQTDE